MPKHVGLTVSLNQNTNTNMGRSTNVSHAPAQVSGGQTMTAYQMNLRSMQKNFFDEEEEDKSLRGTLGRIQTLSEQDPVAGKQTRETFQSLMMDPNSSYYQPYSTPTVQFTNPQAEENTYAMQSEWQAMQEELSYWANRRDRNMSDDDIVNKVKGEMQTKYPTLYQMDQSMATGQNIVQLTEGSDFSTDAMYGTLWAARNPDFTGDIYDAMANSALGRGNVWTFDQDLADRLDPKNKKYNPYSVGSTAIDDAAVYFNVATFDRDWLERNQDMANSQDKTRQEMYRKVETAEQNTREAEAAVEALQTYLKNRAGKLTDYGAAKKILDQALADGKVHINGQDVDISILNDMDKTMGKDGKEANGNLLMMTRPVEYKYADMLTQIDQNCKANLESGNGMDYVSAFWEGGKYSSQQKETAKAQNGMLQETAGSLSGDATADQQDVRANTWDVMFNSVKNAWDQYISAGIHAQSALIKETARASVSSLGTSILSGADVLQGYTSAEKNLEDLKVKKQELEAQYADIGMMVHAGESSFEDRSIPVTVNGQTINVGVTWNPDMNSYTPGGSKFEEIPDGITREQYDQAALQAMNEANAIHEYLGRTRGVLTEEEQAIADQYKDITNQINQNEQFINANREQYEDSRKETEESMNRYQNVINMMKESGIDTREMEDAYDVAVSLLEFTKYDPTVWQSYNVYHEYSQIMYAKDGDWEKQYAVAKSADDEIMQNIEYGEWVLGYMDRNGMDVPDSVKSNLQRWLDALYRQHEDFENMSLIQEENFSEMAKKGREMAEEGVEWIDGAALEEQPGWNILSDKQKEQLKEYESVYDVNDLEQMYYSALEGFEHGMGMEDKLFGPYRMKDLLTDYETDTFYYLLATQGLEGANRYIEHLTDDYGVLHSRAADKTKESADTMADSDFWGRRAADVLSMLLSPVSTIGSLYYMGDVGLRRLRGENVEVNPNNINLSANIFKKEARAEIQNEINRVYADNPALRTFMSTAQEIISNRGDSFVNMITFGPLFKDISTDLLQEFVGALPMAFSAATDAIAAAKEKGASDTQLLGVFLSTLLAESATETISIGNMKEAFQNGFTGGTMKQFLKNWLTNSGISEMIGESINDVVENMADEVFLGDNSEYNALVNHYQQEEHMSLEDAQMAARRDQLMGVLHTALVSYLSPGLDVVQYARGELSYINNVRLRTRDLQQKGFDVSVFDIMRADKEAAKSQQRQAEQAEQETAPAEQAETAEAPAPEVQAPQDTTESIPDTSPAETQEQAPTGKEQTIDEFVTENLSDYTALTNALKADKASQTATLASVLDTEKTDASSDRAKAAAALSDQVAEKIMNGKSAVEVLNQLIIGAGANETVKTDTALVKQALENAILGGEESVAYQLMQTEEYQKATDAEKARMLAETVQHDQADTVLQGKIDDRIYDARIEQAKADVLLKGIAKAEQERQKSAQDKETAAAQAWQAAKDALQEKTDIMKAKADSMQRTAENFQSNMTKENGEAYHRALEDLKSAEAVVGEYEQSEENAHVKLDAAREVLQKANDELDLKLNQEATAQVQQEDADRAQKQAEIAAAEQKQIEEAQQAQAEEDERTGKTKQDQDYSQIDAYVDSLNLDKEKSDKLKQEMKDRRDVREAKKADMSGRMTDAQSLLALGAMQRKLNIPIMFSDDLGAADGMYKDGIIYLNGKRAKDGTMRLGHALVQVALHEVTHSLEQTKSYAKYRDIVMGTLYGYGDDFNAERLDHDIKQKQDLYRKNGKELTREDAEKEIVADFAKKHLSNKDVVNRFMDAGMGGKMRNMLHNINQALKNHFTRMDPADREIAENLRKAEYAFQKALIERSKTAVHPGGEQFSIAQFAQATNMRYDEKTQTLYTPDGKKIDGVTPGAKVTRAMIQQTPVGKLIDLGLSDDGAKDAKGNDIYETDENGNDIVDEKGNKVVKTQKAAALDMFAGLMNMVAMLKDHNLVWEIAGSTLESTFSALKSNSDTQYHDTIDFGTICAKTQAIVNVMSEVMMDRLKANKLAKAEGRIQDISYGLTRGDVLKIYNATHEAGLSVPCPVCYVFSRWMGVPSLLGQMSRFQHEFVAIEEDENGDPVLDENGYAKFDPVETQRRANDYIQKMHALYGDKDGVTDRKDFLTKEISKLEDKDHDLATEIETLEGILKDQTITKRKRESTEKKLAKKKEERFQNAEKTTELDNELREVEAYNWVTQSLCKQKRVKNEEGKTVTVNELEDDNKTYKIDPDFQVTPDEVLMDMRRTGEFADRYAKNWAYRTSRGAGMGKSILPYSGATIGDILLGKKTRVASDQNPFLSMDDAKATKTIEDAKQRARRQNLIGGQRLQSTSDFRPEWGLDYIMAFLELQAAQSNAQMYTKVVEAVDLFASAGADVNISIMGSGNGYHEATAEEIALAKTDTKEGQELAERMGTAIGEDGKEHTYVLDFSSTTGADYNDSKAKTKKYGNAQMILVGMNDIHIRLALANNDIDFVIPWHSSGNSEDVLSSLVSAVQETLETSSDYTKVQTDKFITRKEKYQDENGKTKTRTVDARTQDQKDMWSARIKILTGVADDSEKGLTDAEKRHVFGDGANPFLSELYKRFYKTKEDGTPYDKRCYHVALTSSQANQIFPYEYWQTDPTKEGGTKATADENGRRFIQYCQAMGVVPRFSGQFDKKIGDAKSGNFAGAVYDKEGNIVRYDPDKMAKGYWKLLIDRRMYDLEGLYRDQKTIDTSGIKVGGVDETGAISDDSMLPKKTSAKYGIPKLERMAATAAESEISKPFNLQENSPVQGGQALFSDDYTDAELDDMLRQAGISYQEATDSGDTKTAEEDASILRSATKPVSIDSLDWEDLLTEEDYDEIERELFGEEEEDTTEVITAAVEDLKDEFDPTIFGGRLYVKPETLDYWLSDEGFASGNPNYGTAYIAMMDPADFLRMTTTTPEAQQQRLDETTPLNTGTDRNGEEASLDRNAKRQPIQLKIDSDTGKIMGHEGRHRSIALARAGIKQIPVLLVDGREGYKYNKTPREEMELTGQDPEGVYTISNGNKLVLHDVLPLTNKYREEIAKRFTASEEDRKQAEMNGQRLVQYSFGDEGQTSDVDLDDHLRQAGVTMGDEAQTGGPLHDIRQVVSSLGWTESDGKVYDEENNLVGTIKGNRVEIDPNNERIGEYRNALNGVRFAPDQTGATLEGEDAGLSSGQGTKERQFGTGMLQDSDEIAREAKAYILKTYKSETNAEQIDRAIKWIRSNKQTPKSDGYYESLDQVTSPTYDYRSADGQARMIAMMGMAVARGDTMAQVALADAFNRQGTDLGRALQARKLFKLMTPEGRIQSLQKMIGNLQSELDAKGTNKELKFSDWIYQAAAVAESEEDFDRVRQAAITEIATQLPVSWLDKIRSWRMLAMLGNPRTHIRNVMGNALFVPAVSIKNKVGAIGEILTRQDERTKTLKLRVDKETRDFAKADADAMEDVLRGDAKYGEETKAKMKRRIWGNGNSLISRTLGKALQGVYDFNSDMLENEDWIFLKGHYTRALGGWMDANGYTPEQLQNDPQLLEKGRKYAIEEAQRATYRDFSKTAKALNNVSREGGPVGFVLDAALPFKKTPINILKRGMEYSPLGIAKALTYDARHLKQWNDYQEGKLRALPEKAISPNQFIDKIASGLTGSAVMAVGALLSSLGVVECGLNDDDEDEYKKEQGEQKYSIKLFGHDVSYTMDWAAPMSMPFFVGASIQKELAKDGSLEIGDLVKSLGNISEPVFNLSMLDGVNSLLNTSQGSDENTVTQILGKMFSNYVTSFYPALFAAASRTFADNTRRMAYVQPGHKQGLEGTFNYMVEQMQNKTPWSTSNIPMADVFGRPETVSFFESLIENFFSPGYISDIKDDPILNEMFRLYSARVKDSDLMVPKKAPYSFSYKGEKVNLTAKQYQAYRDTRGQTAYTMLTDIINSPEYQGLTDPAKQVRVVKAAWDYANEVGKKAVFPDYSISASSTPLQDVVREGKIDYFSTTMFESLEDGDYTGAKTMMQGLRDEGLDDDKIKEMIAKKYRDQYKEAYLKNDTDTMLDIQEMLDNTGYTYNFKQWKKDADKKNK